jgi:hypothetical protein
MNSCWRCRMFSRSCSSSLKTSPPTTLSSKYLFSIACALDRDVLSRRYLDRYKARARCFNDDVSCCLSACASASNPCLLDQIQGTGAVVLSGFINAARLSSEASGLPLTEHKILFFGSGSAGVGVAKQLLSFFTLLGLSEAEAKSRIYVCETCLWTSSSH